MTVVFPAPGLLESDMVNKKNAIQMLMQELGKNENKSVVVPLMASCVIGNWKLLGYRNKYSILIAIYILQKMASSEHLF